MKLEGRAHLTRLLTAEEASLYFITQGGARVCFSCVSKNRKKVTDAVEGEDDSEGWHLVAFDINSIYDYHTEGEKLQCDYCGEALQSIEEDGE
jgi:hypothetical protein